MIDLAGPLSPEQRAFIAIDKSNMQEAATVAMSARDSGVKVAKLGLELSSLADGSWGDCSQLASWANLEWVADAKLPDIPNTSLNTLKNIVHTVKPPIAVTIHSASGSDAMAACQEFAAENGVKLLAVTELTSKDKEEIKQDVLLTLGRLGLDPRIIDELSETDASIFRNAEVETRALKAAAASIFGLVASPREIKHPIKDNPQLADKFLMIPGTRSAGVDANDQKNVETPYQAILDGADALVIGREFTSSVHPQPAFDNIVQQIDQGLLDRGSKGL